MIIKFFLDSTQTRQDRLIHEFLFIDILVIILKFADTDCLLDIIDIIGSLTGLIAHTAIMISSEFLFNS